MENKLLEVIRKIVDENKDLINQGEFDFLFEQILGEHGYQVDEEFFKMCKDAGIGGANIEELKNMYYCNHRIKQIKCYNVGFGDCFLCKDDTDNGAKMLVDCGGEAHKLSAVATDLMCEYANVSRKYLMLSHLHKDHYDGLHKLFKAQSQLKFNAVYLPNYITNGSLELYASMIFLDPNSDLAREARDVLQIPGILQKNCAPNAKIYFLSEGGKVFNSLCAFETLLPRRHRERLWNEDIEPIREFCERYKKILGYTEDESGSVTVSINVERNVIDLVEEFYHFANENNERVSESELKKLKKHFKTNRNELSLAFHELGIEDSQNVLFLGDANPTDIKHLADNNKLKHEYCFVKVQHHGTRNYFYNGLPVSKYYGISNGGGRESWEITDAYDFQYGKCASFVCTNNCNCKKFKNNIICNAHSNMKTQCGVNLSYTVKI